MHAINAAFRSVLRQDTCLVAHRIKLLDPCRHGVKLGACLCATQNLENVSVTSKLMCS